MGDAGGADQSAGAATFASLLATRNRAIQKDPFCVWSHFSPLLTPDGQARIRCDACKLTLTASNPSASLIRHLGGIHCNVVGRGAKESLAKLKKDGKKAMDAERSAAEVELDELEALEGAAKRKRTGAILKAVAVVPSICARDFKDGIMLWALCNPGTISFNVMGDQLTMHATSCSCERLWSMMRWVYRENRSRLGLEKAKMMMLVAGTERLQQKQAKADFLASEEALVESVFGF